MDNVLATIGWNDHNLQSDNFNASLIFNPLSKQDNGSYVCNAHIRPVTDHGTLVIDGMNSHMLDVTLVGEGSKAIPSY